MFMMQKIAIRMIKQGWIQRLHKCNFCIASGTLKCIDLVKVKTALIMYKARNNLLPKKYQGNVQRKQGGNNLRGNLHFKTKGPTNNEKNLI